MAEARPPQLRVPAVPLYALAVMLAVAALNWANTVVLPLAAATFAIFTLWPLRRALARIMPAFLANLATLGVLVGLVAVFMGLLGWSLRIVLTTLPDYAQQTRDYLNQLMNAQVLQRLPVEVPVTEWISRATRFAANLVGSGLSKAYSGAGTIFLMLVYFYLGLVEVPALQRRVVDALQPESAEKAFRLGDILCRKFGRYVVVRTLVGAMTGLFVGLYLWILDVEFAVAFGFQAYLLNYIPMLGSIIAVILPTGFVLVESQSLTETAVMAGGLTGIQLFIGNYIDPRIQGRQFHITPPLVLLSILFWGFLWGVPGALLGVPITIALLLILDAFPRTQWISRLVGDMREAPDAVAPAPAAAEAEAESSGEVERQPS